MDRSIHTNRPLECLCWHIIIVIIFPVRTLYYYAYFVTCWWIELFAKAPRFSRALLSILGNFRFGFRLLSFVCNLQSNEMIITTRYIGGYTRCSKGGGSKFLTNQNNWKKLLPIKHFHLVTIRISHNFQPSNDKQGNHQSRTFR